MPRSRLGPLAIESKLGDQPSRSCVWRAVHLPLQRAIAVKVFSVAFGATPEARAKLAREWEVLKKLQHPAIAQCYGGGFEETDAYLAHELVDGETLSAQLERRNRLPWETVLDLAEPVASALEYLHARNIVHGQLLPDKIIVSGLSPILIDVRQDRFGSPFRSGQALTPGEWALCAPEIVSEPGEATALSDLYALGAILYLAITGRPPIGGDSETEVRANVLAETPASVASIVMDCPIWFDQLIMQLLQKDPAARHHSAKAVNLALAEVRKRSMSRTSAAEHASAGFSPLNVTDQEERDKARQLLGKALLNRETVADYTPWHDNPWILVTSLLAIIAIILFLIWPLNEEQMRRRAEKLLAQESGVAMSEAKQHYLLPMLSRFPDGEHRQWAEDQLIQVEMYQAEQKIRLKLKNNLPLSDEGERLYAEATKFEQFGDTATALDRYRSMETLLGDNAEYAAYVNLARRQIAAIEADDVDQNEATSIILAKLAKADELATAGEVIAARKIWYSVVELYSHNENVAPLVARAQERLAGNRVKESDQNGS